MVPFVFFFFFLDLWLLVLDWTNSPRFGLSRGKDLAGMFLFYFLFWWTGQDYGGVHSGKL